MTHEKYQRLVDTARTLPPVVTAVAHPCDASSLSGAVDAANVREAIKMLTLEGIVVTRPRSWAVVREFTLKDIQDFADVRTAFETLAFVLAAERQARTVLSREPCPMPLARQLVTTYQSWTDTQGRVPA